MTSSYAAGRDAPAGSAALPRTPQADAVELLRELVAMWDADQLPTLDERTLDDLLQHSATWGQRYRDLTRRVRDFVEAHDG